MLRRRIVAFAAGAALAAIIAPALQAQRAQRAQQLGPSALSMPAVPTATTSGVDESVKDAAAQAVHQATQQAAQQIAMSRMPALVVPKGAPTRLSRAPITQVPAMRTPAMQVPATQAPAAPPVRTVPTQAAPQPRTTPAPTITATSKTPTTATSSVTTGATPVTGSANADAMLTKLAPQMDLRMGGGKNDNGLHLSGTVGIVVMMGLLTLLPTLLLLMTGFTRILIVLHFLRQALGTQNAPPAHLVAALALILTGFVMAPTLTKVNDTALQPWMDGKIEQGEMLKTAVVPFRDFMLKHTRDHDLQVFIDMSQGPQPTTEADIPLVTLVSAFATSELRTSFQIGFAIFLPFIIIDIVVSSVLMSMGMFMLPPAMISLPFKLLLFVLVDGWTLVVQSLVTSFRV
jgi:flagellar biosynthetic protein FliP